MKLGPKINTSCKWKPNSVMAPLLEKSDMLYSPAVHTNRSNVANTYGSLNPHEIFELFIDGEDGLLDLLVTETKRYAQSKYADMKFDIEKEEMKKYIGHIRSHRPICIGILMWISHVILLPMLFQRPDSTQSRNICTLSITTKKIKLPSIGKSGHYTI